MNYSNNYGIYRAAPGYARSAVIRRDKTDRTVERQIIMHGQQETWPFLVRQLTHRGWDKEWDENTHFKCLDTANNVPNTVCSDNCTVNSV